jgi:predicted DNA-binding transcriptional regulator YafY
MKKQEGCHMQSNLALLNILKILKTESDVDHKFSQKQIQEALEKEYGMKVDRKTVKRNLDKLLEAGFDLEYTEFNRKDKNGEDNSVMTDWYLNREFDDSELRLLIDGLLFSKHVPYEQRKELIEKLAGLSNRHFKKRMGHICLMPDNMPVNDQLFLTIEVLDEAISMGCKVSFQYTRYGADKKRHEILNSEGGVREYIVSPYQMVAANSRYFLICNTDPHENVSHYRLDGIYNIDLLDEPAKAMEKVEGLKNRLQLSSYMAEHLYMYSGEGVQVAFKAKKTMIGAILDWFGMDVSFSDETAEDITVRLKVHEEAMLYWAKQYSDYIEVLKPESLREKLRLAADEMLRKYKKR